MSIPIYTSEWCWKTLHRQPLQTDSMLRQGVYIWFTKAVFTGSQKQVSGSRNILNFSTGIWIGSVFTLPLLLFVTFPNFPWTVSLDCHLLLLKLCFREHCFDTRSTPTFHLHNLQLQLCCVCLVDTAATSSQAGLHMQHAGLSLFAATWYTSKEQGRIKRSFLPYRWCLSTLEPV